MKEKRRGMSWTRKEIIELRRTYGSRANSEVAVSLKRTAKAVERKAAKLGIFKSKKYLKTLGRKV